MDPQFEFELRTHEKRASLARVLHYIKQRADKDLHRKGGCSAFQVAVELARCLVIAFTISLRNCSPSIEAATRFVIHCCALVGAYEEAGKLSKDDWSEPPDGRCWHVFFFLVSNELAGHPDGTVACELSILTIGKLVYLGREMTTAQEDGRTFENFSKSFAVEQLDLLIMRAREEPAWLAYSIEGPVCTSRTAHITIYKPPEDAVACVLQIANILARSLREHNINVCLSSMRDVFVKVLAICALWKGFAVGRTFATAFMQRYLPSFSDFIESSASNAPVLDCQAATDFMDIVHHFAVPWQNTAPQSLNPHEPAPELRGNGESIAVEHVLDTLLKRSDSAHGIDRQTLEAIVVRHSPELPDPCLTQQEYNRVLYRKEIYPDSVLHAARFPFNLITLAGAPPYYLHPPTCALTPAEVVCYMPHVMCIPEIWKWISSHGWTPFNIPKLFNKARNLQGIWTLDHNTLRNWQRNSNAAFRERKDLKAPPRSPTLDISPYVYAYCQAPKRIRQHTMMDMSMSRLVLSVERHPVGDDAGRFTAFARYAALNGDVRGKVLVKHVGQNNNALDTERVDQHADAKTSNSKDITGVSDGDFHDDNAGLHQKDATTQARTDGKIKYWDSDKENQWSGTAKDLKRLLIDL